MLFDISGVRSRGESAAFSYEPDLSEILPAALWARVSGEAAASGSPKGGCRLVTLNGALTARLAVRCDRCAEPFESEKTVEVSCVVARTTEMSGAPDAGDSGSIFVWDGDRIELDDVFIPAFILDLDMKTLCRDDCAGLCQRCGKNLNHETCGCNR